MSDLFGINYIQGWSPHHTGVTRVCGQMFEQLSILHRSIRLFDYSLRFSPSKGRVLYQDYVFPLRIKLFSFPDSVNILGNQTLAGILPYFHQPSIVIVHDLIQIEEMPASGYYRNFLKRWLDGLTMATRIMTTTTYVKKCVVDLAGIPEDRIRTIPLGVDRGLFRPLESHVKKEFLSKYRLAQDRRYLLFVGSEHPRKNFKTALKILEKMAAEDPTIALIKIGAHQSPEGRKAHIEEAKRLRVSDLIYPLEDLNDQDLAAAYNVADVLLFPSLNEGFGLPLLEAMASGLPIVASDRTSIPEVLGDVGVMHPPYGVDAMVQSVRRLLYDQPYHQMVSEKGIERAKAFSWSQSGKELYNVVKEIVSRKQINDSVSEQKGRRFP